MRQLAKFSVIAVVISTVSGCGWLWGEKGYFRDRSNDYLDAKQEPMITIPANLKKDTRPFDPLYPIPNNIPNPTITKNYEVPRPLPLQAVNASGSFSLQRNQGNQWIIAQQMVTPAYEQALQYFRQAGFHIDTARPVTGEFTTSWTKTSVLTNMLNSRLLAMDSSLANQELRVRVRVDPGARANTSELYTLVMVRPEGSSVETDWPSKSQNSVVEAILLDELMANMSNSQASENVVSLSDTQQQSVATQKKALFNRDTQGIPFLVMNGDLDLVWSQVEQAINKANIKIDDMDRSERVYYINLSEKADGSSKPGFFTRLFTSEAKREASAERYIIKVIPIDNAMSVKVEGIGNDTVVSPEKAESILKLLQDNMN
ncbi:hypothetical protein DKL61_07415 [Gammaproteobacteria bacterium ESL0073]|nr:hypothetical protein DKL61_07415 [Gammaproteobacteria bacterium ESL0073]